MAAESPAPDEPDVHLSIRLGGMSLDFVACLTAALIFVQEHAERRYVDAISVDSDCTSVFPRLPNERLYLTK
ncbi:hypothetical protein AB0H71_32065 [Nocardia sp. NPDC050697]|uniref:hypothetical protein n=1 Tax=Nocardia sp. NPDC050697 TaxID=3155158 RepID=UPI0033F31578